MLNQFLTNLLKKEVPNENLIGKIFIQKYNEILNAEKEGEVNEIMRSEIKKFVLSDKDKYISDNNLDETLSQANNKVIKNIKFKEIDIEGIKGIPNRSFCKQATDLCSSNNTYLKIPRDKNVISIFGFNGDGKSSFTEAIEYCLLGEVREAKRRNYTKSNINNYIKNVHSDSGEISILFRESDQGKKLKIKRDTSGKFEVIKNDFPDIDIEEFLSKEMNKIFIEKNRIDDFVLSKGKTRTNLYGDLLGFSEINNFIKNYWNDYKTEKKNDIYNKKDKYIKEFRELKSNNLNEPNLNLTKEQQVLLKNKILKKNNIDKKYFIDEGNFKNFISLKDERLKKIQTELEKLEEINMIKKIMLEIKKQKREVKDKQKNLNDYTKEKEVEEMFFDMYEKANLLLEKQEYNDCPLCGDSNKSINEIKNDINKYLTNYKEIKELKDKVINTQKSLNKLKLKLENYTEKLFEISDLNNHILINKKIKEIEEKLIYNTKEKYNLEKEIINDIINKVKEFRKKYRDYLSYDQKLKNIKSKKDKEVKFNNSIEDILSDIYEFESIMKEYHIDLVNNTLVNIADLVQKYYNIIVLDNKISKLNFNTKSKDIEINIEFEKYNETINPELILSEGQLKCFGTSILLALHEESKLKPMILDDIINAVDIDHRQNMIKLIIDELDDKQIFITTYDKLFREKLLNRVDNNSSLSYTFNNNLLCKQVSSYLNEIETAIENRNCRKALLYMRISLENSVYSIAQNNYLKVPFKDRIRKYKLSEIIEVIKRSERIFKPIKNILKDIHSSYQYDLINQEAHFWSEKALTIDHQTLKNIFVKIKAIKKMIKFKDNYIEPIKEFKDFGTISDSLLEINKSINILIKKQNGNYETTETWDSIKDFI